MIASWLARSLLGLLAMVAVAGLGLRLYLGRPAENRLLPTEDVAIGELHGTLPPNAFLACPPGYCSIAGAVPSPIFAIGVDRLYRAFRQLVAAEPRTVLIVEEPPRRLVAIQRSAVLRFPDIIIAEFVPLAAERSSLALYGRARYGRYDFGVNRRRIERWLALLKTTACAAQ